MSAKFQQEQERIAQMHPSAGAKFNVLLHLSLFERELLRVLWQIQGEMDSISYCLRKGNGR